MKSDEAQLIFLNEIEINTVKAVEAINALIEKNAALLAAIEAQTERLIPKPFPEIKQTSIDLEPVVNATMAVSNTILKSQNKSDTVLASQISLLVESNRAIIAQLETLNKPKKWEFKIDRNFKTGLIQAVTAEVVNG